MAKFNPADYEMVEDRLKKFWKDFPNGRIWTEVVKTSEDGTMVVVQAMIYADKEDLNPVSTGIAQELQGQGGFANTDAWMENCETSAIGRALANWIYQGSTKKRPSLEEMSKTQGATKVAQSKPKQANTTGKAEGVSLSSSSASPVKEIKDAGFGDRKNDKHQNGKLAMDDTGLLCPCDKQCAVNYIPPSQKKTPKSPDFRCSMLGQCVGGDTVDGKVFAKSWWSDGWNTPESWKDYAAVQNGIKLPDVKTVEEGKAPF